MEKTIGLLTLLLLVLAGCNAADTLTESPEGATRQGTPSAAADYFVGALGCSMTRDLMDPGLKNYTSIDGWVKRTSAGVDVLNKYSGGTIERWYSGNNIKWSAFEAGDNAWPQTNIVIWQLCVQAGEVIPDPNAYIDEMQYIYNRMSGDMPGVPIYVTGMATYPPGHVCSITGTEGVPFSRELAIVTAANTGAILANLDLKLEGAGMLKADGCHASASGAAFQAGQVALWLDSL